MTPTILIASGNPGKLREIQAILGESFAKLVLPAHIGLNLEIVEDGQTYAENAAKKAVAYSQASGLITLADDSGIEVEALGGEPGLHSARYAPWLGATDADRRQYLLEQLNGKLKPWLARFHCTVAIATPQGDLHYTEGNVSGEVIDDERGSGGFGYDPIFYIPQLGRTMAELSEEEKNQISHRALAVREAVPILLNLLNNE